MSTSEQLAKPTVRDIRDFLETEAVKGQLALVLPKHMTPDRFARVAVTAMTKTPKLLECTKESLLRCLMDCSSLGLEPNGRDAHLIPYGSQCTLIVDWKGLVSLARRSGDVALFKADLVKENDSFSWENGTVRHGIDWRADRGKTQAVYSYVKFRDGSEDWEVLQIAEVEAIRKRSKAGQSGPWISDFDEMAKKTAIRRHSKRLTLSPEFQDALDKDDDKIEERAATGREVPSARSAPLNPFTLPPAAAGLPPAIPDDAEEWTDEMIDAKFAAAEMERGAE